MSIKIYDMTVNYLTEPCGVDSLPRFSYKIRSDKRADKQIKRRICVYSSKEAVSAGNADVWDSGIIENGESVLVNYEGEKLAPVTKYYWTVECENAYGETAVSPEASFVTGKLSTRFAGNWIAAESATKRSECAFYLRRVFELCKEVESAYLSICGLGFFESYINGKKTGDDILSPAYTAYDKETFYMQYDVADSLVIGKNALCVELGNGFYNSFAVDAWDLQAATWRNFPKLLCELKITYKDGSQEKILSDLCWKSSEGPITFTSIRNGEYYDARLELGDWLSPSFDDSAWAGVKIAKGTGGLLFAQEMQPIRIYDKFTAIRKWKSKNGYIFDIGQNIAGYGAFLIKGEAGTEVKFRYSDMLTEENELDMETLSCFIKTGEFQTDKYTKKSDSPERWHAKFTYHGFQYIEVIGYEPELCDVTGVAICTDMGDIGKFSCSDEMLNRLQHLCRWSAISNIESFPTDDPHREKNGWTGDTMLSCEQMLTNFGTRAFLSKWSRDMVVSQRPMGQIPCIVPSPGWGYSGLMGPDWSAALIMVPWYIYVYNNDREILGRSYEAIKKNIDFMLTMTDDLVPSYGTGDWCAPFEGPALSVNMGSYKCPVEVTDTGFLYNAAKTARRLAVILGEKEDGEYFSDLAEQVRAKFREKFFDKEACSVYGDCQTATGTMLFFELYDNEEEKQGLIKNLLAQIEEKDNHLDFGVLGCKFVMDSLGRAGLGDVGTKMLCRRTFPGVAEWIDRGATTLWECWNGGGSHNHHMFSSLSSFMYKYIAGIAPDEREPGFNHIIFRPAVDSELTSAEASHESMLGKVACDWAKDSGNIKIKLEVPFGAYGTLYLPEEYAGKLQENGNILDCRVENGKALFTFKSGEYMLETASECAS